jgi:hypothetical protein
MESGDFVEKLVSFCGIWPLKNKKFANLKKKSPFGGISPQKRTLALTDTQQRTPKGSCFLTRHLGATKQILHCLVDFLFFFVGLYEMKGFGKWVGHRFRFHWC